MIHRYLIRCQWYDINRVIEFELNCVTQTKYLFLQFDHIPHSNAADGV